MGRKVRKIYKILLIIYSRISHKITNYMFYVSIHNNKYKYITKNPTKKGRDDRDVSNIRKIYSSLVIYPIKDPYTTPNKVPHNNATPMDLKLGLDNAPKLPTHIQTTNIDQLNFLITLNSSFHLFLIF